jgi:uncharacterized protein (UPF0218 family)
MKESYVDYIYSVANAQETNEMIASLLEGNSEVYVNGDGDLLVLREADSKFHKVGSFIVCGIDKKGVVKESISRELADLQRFIDFMLYSGYEYATGEADVSAIDEC